MKTRICLLMLAGLAVSASAMAQMIQSYDAIFSATQIAVGSPNYPIDFTLPKFDSNLGTLQAVSITLTSTIDASVSVYNSSSASLTFDSAFADFSGSNGINVTGPGGTAITYHPSITVGAGTANPGQNSFGTVEQTFQSTVSPAIGGYAAAGGGTLNLAVNSSAIGTYGITKESSSLFGGSAVTASGDVGITYAYSPIPEPATYAALLGAAALGLVIRRRKQAVV
jgi:hypothetical protein